MRIGEVVGGRFLVRRFVGAGGSAKVYECLDHSDGQPAALKVLSARGQLEDERFEWEACALAELSHPAIVRYVAHGDTSDGQPFLAMEWLEGETLSERLSRGALSIEDSLAVVRQTAEALADAHLRGLVHRDIKPSNLFLMHGESLRLKVLDFGIAKFPTPSRQPTSTGMFLGTVGYMAPEQAVACRDADARADVFSLGCVLFECLTGQPAFAARHAVAVLAKVLTEAAPRLSEIRPDLGGALDSLAARMMSKELEDRPAHAAAVLRELDALSHPKSDRPAGSEPPPSLTGRERRVVSVVMVQAGASPGGTLASADVRGPAERIESLAAEVGAQATVLSNGTLLLLLCGRGAASDRAAQAAACTLALRRERPDLRIVLATGFADAGSPTPVGPVIDRAANLLCSGVAVEEEGSAGGVLLDTISTRLLASRFEIRNEDTQGPVLLSERTGYEAAHRVLGIATPCVGRDKERALLSATFDECMTERAPRAVLVTAEAGIGKSRLAKEFIADAARDHGVRTLVARSASTGAGSAFLLARQLIRGATRLMESESARDAHAKLLARLAPALGEKRARLTAEFLCEVLGTPISSEPSPVLVSARGDARLMADWMRRSFDEWLAVEATEPLLIVLEDLHWGDTPTVTYVGDTLWRTDLPLMVLALARPEVRETFPTLWAGALQEVRLSGLGRRACETLVRAVLESAEPSIVEQLVLRANGNAFYLEELIRAVAEGHADALPETVVAVAHAGLDRLEPEARRVLRAASVFGGTFRPAAVARIAGEDARAAEWLARLEQREVVVRVRSEAPWQDERYTFRHALLRDAAYATLTESDRKTAHLLAAAWLESNGTPDPVTMADHLESAGEPARAVPWVVRAGEIAYAAGSPEDTRRLSARSLAHADGEDRGALQLLDGASALLQGDYRAAQEQLRLANPLFPPASDRWFLGVTTLAYAGTVAGDPRAASDLIEGLERLPVLPVQNPLCAYGLARAMLSLAFAGERSRAARLLGRLDEELLHTPGRERSGLGASSEGWLHLTRGFSFMAGVAALPEAHACAGLAVKLFTEARDQLALPTALCWLGATEACIGRYREAQQLEQRAIECAEASGNLISPSLMKPLLELGRALAGEPEPALEELARVSESANPLSRTVAFWARGEVLLRWNRLGEAESASASVLDKGVPLCAHAASATLARIRLMQGRPQESLELAAECLTRGLRDPFSLSSDAHLVHAESLMQLGQREQALSALGELRERILSVAAELEESDRAPYLEQVQTNARALERALEWIGPS